VSQSACNSQKCDYGTAGAFTEPLRALLVIEARGSLQRMNESQIRVELEAAKAALRKDNPDIADLQTRAESASSSLVVVLHAGRRKPRTPLQEHDLRELVALWSEVKAALEARGAAG
jgi:hypothetical protein